MQESRLRDNGDGRFDSVIAVYHFEDVTDSGPRGFDATFWDSTSDFEDEKSESIETEDSNIADDSWHHIAYCKHADSYSLYIDGEVLKKERSADYLGFAGDRTFIRISGPSKVDMTGSVLVDEVGFFEIGFSVDEVKGLYDDGLTDFLEAMPVDPRKKVATTWGVIKRDRW